MRMRGDTVNQGDTHLDRDFPNPIFRSANQDPRAPIAFCYSIILFGYASSIIVFPEES